MFLFSEILLKIATIFWGDYHITIDTLQKELTKPQSVNFILKFALALEESFSFLSDFFGKDSRKYIEIHSLITLGGLAVAIPFVIKSYKFQIEMKELCRLCLGLESLVLRHRLVGTRAEISTRINDVFVSFNGENPSIDPILEQIEKLKTAENWWFAYWNNAALEKAIQEKIQPATAKFLLWKYENYLNGIGKAGYAPMRFDQITDPELEHIAPQTPPNNEKVASGYFAYNDEDAIEYIECLGNYLLISKSHNCSVGNKPFKEKVATYKHLHQQREIREMASKSKTWGKRLINKRKKQLIEFVLAYF